MSEPAGRGQGHTIGRVPDTDDLTRLAAAPPARMARFVAGALTPANVVLALTAYLCARHASGTGEAVRWWLVVAVLAVAVPYALLFWALRTGRVGDRQVVRRSQRPWLLGLVSICVAGAVVWLWLGGAPPALAVTITAVLTGVVVVALLTMRWKVSAHTATYAAAVTVVGFEQPALAAVLALGIPLVGWARVRAGRHSLGQVLGGAAVGILVAAVVVGALD